MKSNKCAILKGLTDEEMVRKLYVTLGNKFSYDRDYIYSNDWNRNKEIYEKPILPGVLENIKSPNKIKVTCKQMADSLVEAINKIPEELTQEKIKAKAVGYRQDEEMHIGTLVTIGKKNYYLDLYKDLYRIQRGMKTRYFAPSKENLEKIKQQYSSVREDIEGIELKTIDEEQLRQMDLKNGYLKYGLYMDDAIETMRKEMQEEENLRKYIENYDKINNKEERNKIIFKWKIEFIFRYMKNEVLEKDIGISEIDKFYKKIYYSLLTEEEKQISILSSIDIHNKDEYGNKTEGILYKIYIRGEELNYIYEDRQKGFVPISKEEIKERRDNKSLLYDSFEK
ncbi:MAG: hypothetical protein ACI4VH_06080 [Clostridia bacterium]